MRAADLKLPGGTPPCFSGAAARCCAFSITVVLASTAVSCNRHQVATRPSESEPHPAAEQASEANLPPRLAEVDGRTKGNPREVLATWYEVPLLSLAKRRAGLEEFTAANNHLPIGTLVRITHLANGKSVRVRITDRGSLQRGVKLDLCKEAAEELGMVGEGIARVRMEVLEQSDGSQPDDATVAAQP